LIFSITTRVFFTWSHPTYRDESLLSQRAILSVFCVFLSLVSPSLARRLFPLVRVLQSLRDATRAGTVFTLLPRLTSFWDLQDCDRQDPPHFLNLGQADTLDSRYPLLSKWAFDPPYIEPCRFKSWRTSSTVLSCVILAFASTPVCLPFWQLREKPFCCAHRWFRCALTRKLS